MLGTYRSILESILMKWSTVKCLLGFHDWNYVATIRFSGDVFKHKTATFRKCERCLIKQVWLSGRGWVYL